MRAIRKVFTLSLIPLVFISSPAQAMTELESFLLNRMVVDLRYVRSKKQMIEKMSKFLGTQDRAELKKAMAKLHAIPNFSRTPFGYTVEAEGQKVEFDLNRMGEKIVVIDGVTVTFDPTRSIFDQIQNLQQKGSGSKKEVLFNLVVPKAEAVLPPIIYILGSMALGYAFAPTIDVVGFNLCKKSLPSTPTLPDWGLCVTADNALKKKDAEATVAAANAAKNNLVVYYEKCPHLADDHKYRASVFHVPAANWYSVIGEYKDGRVEKLTLYKGSLQNETSRYASYVYNKSFLPINMLVPFSPGEGKDVMELELVPGKEQTDVVLKALTKTHTEIAARLGQELTACDSDKSNIEAKAKMAEKSTAEGGQK